MFRGSFEHVMDQKGRVSVPARFRDLVLGSGRRTLMLTRSIDNPCLEAYPIDAWEEVEAWYQRRKNQEPPLSASQRNLFINFFIGNATECELDEPGRILIPPKLRSAAKLDRDVVFSGAGNRFRIWNAEAWSGVQAEAELQLRSDPSLLDALDF